MRRVFPLLIVGVLTLASAHVFTADWSPELAAKYLDARQEQWFSWKPAASANGPCVSCHTGMTYLLARPALRQVLKDPEPTKYERGLLDRLRSNVGAKPPGALQQVEVIFSAMFLSAQDAKNAMSAHTQKAFDQLWALQQKDGTTAGAWRWYAADLDPWENPGSSYYGASLAALALGSTPGDYREGEALRDQRAMLTQFLGGATGRPLHDRLALLWASSKLSTVLPDAARQALVAEAFQKQQADGGWSLASLGPWMPHPNAPPSEGSHAYATGFAAYALARGGVPASHPGMARALSWLKAHQDRTTGAWPAVSMNKRYPADSMEVLFMQDAATAFASMALIETNQ